MDICRGGQRMSGLNNEDDVLDTMTLSCFKKFCPLEQELEKMVAAF
jgi:hypothetical protein